MDSSITINLNSEEHEQLTVDRNLLIALIARLAKAQEKHPEFADGM